MNPWRVPASGSVAAVVRRWTVFYVLAACFIADFIHSALYMQAQQDILAGNDGWRDDHLWVFAFLLGIGIGLPFYLFNLALCSLDVFHPQAAQAVRIAFWAAVHAVMHERSEEFKRDQAQQAADKKQEQMMTRAFEKAMDNRARSHR